MTQMNPAEAVNNFAAWLTTRPVEVCFGENNDCGEIARLVGLYIETQGFDPIRDVHDFAQMEQEDRKATK